MTGDDSNGPRFGERVPERVEGDKAPDYGEYAPPGWVNPVAVSVDEVESEPSRDDRFSPQDPTASTRGAAPSTPAESLRAFDAPPPTGSPVPGPPPAAIRRGSFNRFATVLLIGYGIFRVIDAALRSGQFAQMYISSFTSMGYVHGTFESVAALQRIGVISAVASVPIFLVVVVWSLRRLRAGKNSWIPLLVTGLVVALATGAAVVVVVMGDPSFVSPTGL